MQAEASNRRQFDAYMTPGALAVAICERVKQVVPLPAAPRILEPGCGTGAFVFAASETWSLAAITALDIDPQYRRLAYAAGAIEFREEDYTAHPPADYPYSLVIGNPPYAQAEAFVHRAAQEGMTVCFLMRAAFRAGARRWSPGGVFGRRPPTVTFPVIPRPSFTGGGTEHSEYEVFLWTSARLYSGPVEPIVWRAPRGVVES